MVLVFAGESHTDDEITRLRADLAAVTERMSKLDFERTAAELDRDAIRDALAAVTAERDRMREALRLVISDIIDYERANKLYPNPGKQHCWQSVRDALVLLEGVTKKEGVGNE